jgi:CBS domain-containing protein
MANSEYRMRVIEVLHHKGKDVTKISTVDGVTAAIERLAEKRIGALVVVDRWGKLAGMFSERDVVRALALHGANALQCQVHEFMTPDVTTCQPDDRVDEAMQVMTAHRIRHLPVMEDGRIIGIVSIGDLVNSKLQEKEREAQVLHDLMIVRSR